MSSSHESKGGATHEGFLATHEGFRFSASIDGFREMELDVSGGKIYWSNGLDDADGKLYRCNLNGSAVRVIASSQGTDSGTAEFRILRIDTTNEKIYWYDFQTDEIRRSDLDGGNKETILDGATTSAVIDIALDISGGKLYWTSSGAIRSADLDGSNPALVKSNDAWRIALDVSNSHIYYTRRISPGTDTINRIGLTGSGDTELLGSPSLSGNIDYFVLDLDNGKIYFDTSTAPRKLRRCNLDGTSLTDIATINVSMDPRLDTSAGKLYVAVQREMYKMNLDGTSSSVILDGDESPLDAELDLTNAKIYFGQDSVGDPVPAILRSDLDGANVEVLVS